MLDLAFQIFVLSIMDLEREGDRIGEHLLVLHCDI